LAYWAAKIKEQCAWKYSRPTEEKAYRAAGGKGGYGQEYEKVVKFNYSTEELEALIDVIGMLKGLGSLMMKTEHVTAPLLRRCIHDDVQDFLQTEVRALHTQLSVRLSDGAALTECSLPPSVPCTALVTGVASSA
jgi:cytoplasmic FMR1 interacting protein